VRAPLIATGFKKGASMPNPSEFEIPASILAASVVAKSELTGNELLTFAFNIQRTYAQRMLIAREKEENQSG
jgi:hypothetical protein